MRAAVLIGMVMFHEVVCFDVVKMSIVLISFFHLWCVPIHVHVSVSLSAYT